ncbi:MAG TPA: Gfo/Idh/MocA family oxidoreductase [Candidatus Acidoferrales bacterium]|nr:Gfo/Idh/MocA family oxidoreductase [Candidatus Acidoferrales bacterium]
MLRVGLVGAGPWARGTYAPMLAAGPETRLECVWSRRADAALELAAAYGTVAAPSFEELLARCEAVAFAVPPDVQAELGVRAARAGLHLLLEKPLALTLDDATRLAEAVRAAGVVTQLMLTHRFRPSTAAFFAAARATRPIGARLAFLSGAFLRGPYATPWRIEHGALHDLGPHAFDLLEGALGPIVAMRGLGDPRGWVALACRHEGGAVSDVALSGVMRLPHSIFRIDVLGEDGDAMFDGYASLADDPFGPARRAFADAVRAGRPGGLDVRRGLELQALIEQAFRALSAR